ncbi:purine-cytosine permease family protein [Mycolicibacterium grossiae]|uniref:Cytosine permease n=1 Tax=Mycolicibacterium grossiae TaxID=1552759 RepID=A0A1E8Q442_9MYCO|nr:cytosine permease [Mycolicibacterium grossiae]OFJ53353.1 cytosine permease [Mycolicibacterium grossiae]QEM43609.1 cytosine permease [Mycolicibacterium grossiae]
MPETPAIESKSIDWVPLDERRGKPSTLFPLWFMSNANLTTLATGMVGAALGASLVTSLVAIVLGAAVGTVFTAFHSAQGPQLGLPQMIQSRAQFGYRGVVVICAVVVFSIVGFNVFNQILAADVLTLATGTDLRDLWFVLITACALTLAIYGYHWIHRFQTWLTWLFLATFGVFTVAALIWLDVPAGQFGFGGFTWAGFLVQFGAAAAYALGWAPYVSDYSRYLPPQTSPRKALWFTYSGVFVGAVWLMALGALVAALFADASPLEAVRSAADGVLPGSGTWLLVAALPGLVTVITVNVYAASLELITMIDSFKAVRPTRRLRIVSCIVIAAAGLLGAILSSGEFLANFSSFLVVLLYLLVPWTSVNLVDYYFVRRGRYAIREIFVPEGGVYGSWGWRGLAAYAVGIVAMVPFVVTVWYTGPVAAALGDVDVALFVGLLASAVAYVLMARSLDLAAETAKAEADSRDHGVEAVTFAGRVAPVES